MPLTLHVVLSHTAHYHCVYPKSVFILRSFGAIFFPHAKAGVDHRRGKCIHLSFFFLLFGSIPNFGFKIRKKNAKKV